MYGASLAFLAAGIGALLLAIRRGGLTLVFVSIACSVMSALLLAVSVLRRAADAPEPASEPSDWTGTAARVVAIPRRGTYHASTCRHVAGRGDVEPMTVAAAKDRGFSACGVCRPG